MRPDCPLVNTALFWRPDKAGAVIWCLLGFSVCSAGVLANTAASSFLIGLKRVQVNAVDLPALQKCRAGRSTDGGLFAAKLSSERRSSQNTHTSAGFHWPIVTREWWWIHSSGSEALCVQFCSHNRIPSSVTHTASEHQPDPVLFFT